MRMRTVGIIAVAGVFLLTLACIGGLILIGLTSNGVTTTGDHVAIVPVRGAIVSYSDPSVFGSTDVSAEHLVQRLDELAEDDNVRAVLLQVDSPGGGVNASAQIHDAVQRVQASGKPVVVWFGDTAASGGYYISASADQIIAMPGTITGSIGVIAQVVILDELFDKLGIELETVQTGEYKDMLSPARPLTEDERELLADILDESYEEFVRVVAEGRDMPEEEVRELADGRIFSGQQAQENGLVDDLGNFRYAISVTGELAGLGSDPTTVTYTRETGLFGSLAGFAANALGIELPIGSEVPSSRITVKY